MCVCGGGGGGGGELRVLAIFTGSINFLTCTTIALVVAPMEQFVADITVARLRKGVQLK